MAYAGGHNLSALTGLKVFENWRWLAGDSAATRRAQPGASKHDEAAGGSKGMPPRTLREM